MKPFVILLASLAGALHAAEPVQFNRDIRPILSDNCFACHGPDEKKRDSGLRLDIREEAVKERDGIRAIVPGKPAESDLVERITSKDEDEVMPPPKTHKKLTAAQIETIKRWIAEGAQYQGHWAFISPSRPTVPSSGDRQSAIVNPIDGFIRARLAQEGLSPSPEAPKETLIRRVSLDLTGLPPTPEEVDAFLADASPKAYEKVVDRLLASPRYGERMAIEWLDYARYADSNGFQSDTSRTMWHWRDWVIDAFNRNMRFDQFTTEQLAGDLLPKPTRDQIVATGFHRNHRLNGEGGRIVEEWFAESVIDRVETTGSTWLALTFNCCRCHDHKFDPITQKEFYQFFAFFNSIDETGVMDEFGGAARTRSGGNSKPVLLISTPEEEKEEARLAAAVKAAEQRVAEGEKQAPQLQKEWEKKLATELETQGQIWQPLAADDVTSEGGATLKQQPDGSWLASGRNPKTDVYTIRAPIAAGELTGLRIEALPDASLPGKSLGRAMNGNFVLTGVEAEITASTLPQQLRAEFIKAKADFSQKDWDVKTMLDETLKVGDPKTRKGWAIEGNKPENRVARKAMFVVGTPLTVPPEAQVIVRLRMESIHAQHNIGRFRLSITSRAPAAVKLDEATTPEAIRKALAVAAEKRTPALKQTLSKYYRENVDGALNRANAAVAEARKKLADFQKTIPNTMVMRELAQPREAFILKRGEYDKRGDKVQRALPAALPPLPAGAPLNRLGLARWIVSPQNPLTARVWVNRAWEKFFGIGLVRTSENFGSQSEWPSNPALLDWLATEFVRLGWDMKAMQKTMVMSATYRQSAKVTPEIVARDPENRLLARGPRFRLPAEVIRDQALAISGLLVEKLGGPSVKPYMPERVWDETSVYGDMRGYKIDTGEGLYRRSLYTIWKRTASPPSMTMFDSPTREICTVKRSRTNTPLQALSLMNEVTFVEAARVFAQRMLAAGATPEERIAWAFKRATCRAPSADEMQLLAAGLAKRLEKFRAQPDAATQLLKVGAAPADSKADAAEIAAYTVTANVLLNLDEVVTRN
jgi:hypothetical protein